MADAGLVDAHAYSLISTQLITLKNGKTERLLQIRNPWGAKEWNGKWSDNDPLWNDYKSQVTGFESKDDGVFFISFDDYDKFFYLTTICFFRHDYDEASTVDQHATPKQDPNPFGIMKFVID